MRRHHVCPSYLRTTLTPCIIRKWSNRVCLCIFMSLSLYLHQTHTRYKYTFVPNICMLYSHDTTNKKTLTKWTMHYVPQKHNAHGAWQCAERKEKKSLRFSAIITEASQGGSLELLDIVQTWEAASLESALARKASMKNIQVWHSFDTWCQKTHV